MIQDLHYLASIWTYIKFKGICMKRFLIPMVFIACNSYAAGIQKWVDESGNIHYGDTPPVKTQTQSISVSRPPSNPGRPLPRFTGSSDETKADNSQSEQKSSTDKTTQEVNKQVCESAKKDLDVISGNNIIRLREKDGTERALSDKEVNERRLQLEQNVKQYCH